MLIPLTFLRLVVTASSIKSSAPEDLGKFALSQKFTEPIHLWSARTDYTVFEAIEPYTLCPLWTNGPRNCA